MIRARDASICWSAFSMAQGITASSAVILVVVVSLVSHGVQGNLQDIGDCSFKKYMCMLRDCSTMFYRDLKNNPDDCSGAVVSIKPCVKSAFKVCFGSSLNNNQLETVVKASFKEEQLCASGPLELPTTASGTVLPCRQNFTAVAKNCEKPFHDKYQANKADSALCSSYATSKRCILAATQSLCNFTSLVKEILEASLGDYNPFCASERDPGATGPDYCDGVVIPTLAPTKWPDIGLCPLKKYVCSLRACTKIFYRGLQKNPDDCRGLFPEFRLCMKRITKICMGSALDDDQLDAIVKASFKEKQVCAVGPLEIPTPTPGAELPCGQNFMTEAKRCEQPFYEKFQTNKADSAQLCSLYATAKNCLKSATDSMCNFTSPAKEILERSLDDHNPFCTSERDPGATGPDYCDGVAIITPAPVSAATDVSDL